MIFNPFGMWFRGLLSLAIIAGGISLLVMWKDRLPGERVIATRDDGTAAETAPLATFGERLAAWRPGWDVPTALLAGAVFLLGGSVGGGLLLNPRLWLRRGANDPREDRSGEAMQVKRPDGTVLNVEQYGPTNAPPVILTHGWGANACEWYQLRNALAKQYRVIVWDLPGFGRSTRPDNKDFSVEKMARDLDAVITATAHGKPAVLVGHSIGGMIQLTYARLFPAALGPRVAGMVLVHTTYTNPLATMPMSGLLLALQKPVLEPLCWVSIATAPLLWLMNALSALNGSAHWSNHFGMFAGTETRGELDYVVGAMVKAPPSALMRGNLGMFKYDATPVLPTITVPTLVVAANKDTTTPPEASAKMTSDIPAAEQATLAPARHMGLLERHADLIPAVERFCAKVNAARPMIAA